MMQGKQHSRRCWYPRYGWTRKALQGRNCCVEPGQVPGLQGYGHGAQVSQPQVPDFQGAQKQEGTPLTLGEQGASRQPRSGTPPCQPLFYDFKALGQHSVASTPEATEAPKWPIHCSLTNRPPSGDTQGLAHCKDLAVPLRPQPLAAV